MNFISDKIWDVSSEFWTLYFSELVFFLIIILSLYWFGFYVCVYVIMLMDGILFSFVDFFAYLSAC